MTTTHRKPSPLTCTCDHPVAQHNELGCAAPLWNHSDPNGLNDLGERDYCRCAFRVHRDLEIGPAASKTKKAAKPRCTTPGHSSACAGHKKRMVGLERQLGALFG
jgi:hypothetical protein